MDTFNLKIASAIGTPSEHLWAQAQAVQNLLFTIVLEKNPSVDVNLAAAGKELLLRIEKIYHDTKPQNLETLRHLVGRIVEETTDARISCLTAGLLVGKVLYVAARQSDVLLKRQKTLKPILTAQGALAFSSGFLEEDDIIVFVSGGLRDLIAASQEELFASDEVEEVTEGLLAQIHKASEQGGLVACIAKLKRTAPLVVLEEPKQEERTSRRVALTVFLLLSTLFIASLILGIGKRQQEKTQARFVKVYKEAVQKYDEGVALSDLNPILAQKTLREAKELVGKEQANTASKSKEGEELAELGQKIEEGLRVALRIHTVSDAPVFFDLTVIKEGAVGKSISLFEGKILVLDAKNSVLYTLSISAKRGELVSGNLATPRQEGLSRESGFVLTDEGIERVLFATKKREQVVKKDDSLGEIAALSFFAGNLYLLDKDNGAIYKYQGAQGSRRNYLASDVKPDFSNAVAMAIDGAIWVQFLDGRVSKFVQGAPQAFSIDGLDIPLNNPAGLFTDDETEHLYILDQGNKRVVVVKKDGTYSSQYQWDGIQETTDLVVSEKEKKILLLSGSRIFAIEIK